MAELGFHWPSLVVYLLNFTILLVILYVVGYKRILRVLEQRSNKIRDSLQHAERVQIESEDRQAQMDVQLQEARREGQIFIEEAKEIANKYRDDERNKAKQEAETFLARARDDIQRERDNAMEEVRNHFADLAVVAAEKIVGRSLDKKLHKDIIEQVLSDDNLSEKE